MRYIGIDPGKSGGIAWLTQVPGSSIPVAHCESMPLTERDLWDLIVKAAGVGDCVAYIERVASMPQQGVKSTFTFGYNYGLLSMALTAVQCPFHRVPPGTWQRSLGCLTKGDKNVTKRMAQELWPDIKITHAVADALLIAEYGRRQQTKGE